MSRTLGLGIASVVTLLLPASEISEALVGNWAGVASFAQGAIVALAWAWVAKAESDTPKAQTSGGKQS